MLHITVYLNTELFKASGLSFISLIEISEVYLHCTSKSNAHQSAPNNEVK